MPGPSNTISPTRGMCWSGLRRANRRRVSRQERSRNRCCCELGIDVASHVIRVGRADLARDACWEEISALRDKEEVLLSCVDEEAEARMKAEVDLALRTGDSIGGVFEVVIHGAPAGIGTYANWDERLDGILAQAVMSLQAVKAVEIGRGVTAAESLGSEVHDAIGYAEARENGAHTRFTREHNNAGGIEGGISNGEDVVVRGYLKPISTLRRPLAVCAIRHARSHEGRL